MANTIGDILNDPDFQKFGTDDRRQIVDKALAKDADFFRMPRGDQSEARGKIYVKAGIIPQESANVAAFDVNHPLIAKAAETVAHPIKSALNVMGEHPYATAATLGAGLGPTMPLLGALGAASPVAPGAVTAGIGAAEQMGYQAFADGVNRVLGPDHPWAALAIGMLPPIVGGRVGKSALGINAAVKQAGEAETTQEVSNLNERAEVAKGVADDIAKSQTKEAEQVGKVKGKASEAIAKSKSGEAEKLAQAKAAHEGQVAKVEQANAAKAQTVHEAAETNIRNFAASLDQRADELNQAREAARKSAAAEVAPAEAERLKGEMLGRTPEESSAAIAAEAEPGLAFPSKEAAERYHQATGAIYSPIERASEEAGKRYEAHFAEHANTELPTEAHGAVNAAIEDERKYETESGHTLDPAIQKLFKRVPGTSGALMTDEDIIRRGSLSTNLADEEGLKRILANPYDTEKYYQLAEKVIQQNPGSFNVRIDPATGEWYDITPGNKWTIKQLLKWRSDANKLIGKLTDSDSRNAAWAAVQGADAALEKSGVELPTDLNRQYKLFKRSFGKDFMRKVSTSREPTGLVPHLFSGPENTGRGMMLASGGTPEEKGTMRTLLADWANSNQLSLADIGQKVDHRVLKNLGFNLPDDAWLKMEPKAIELETVKNSSPMARQQYQASFDRTYGNAVQTAANKTRVEGMALAKQLGVIGKPIEAALFKAKTHQEINAIAQKLAQMTPEQVVEAYAQTLPKPPGSAALSLKQQAIQQQAAAARTAIEQRANAAQGAIQQKAAEGRAAIQQQAADQLAQQKLPAQAAREALMNAQPSKAEAMVNRLLVFKSLWLASAGLGAVMSGGHMFATAMGGAAIYGALATGKGMRAIGRQMLKHPEIADMIYDGMKNPRGLNGMQKAGKAAAEVMVLLNRLHYQEKAQSANEDNQ